MYYNELLRLGSTETGLANPATSEIEMIFESKISSDVTDFT